MILLGLFGYYLIENNINESYNLKYDFIKNYTYSYDIKDDRIVGDNIYEMCASVDMLVANYTSDYIDYIYGVNLLNNTTIFTMNISPKGDLIYVPSENKYLLDLQLELPNMIVYPETIIEYGDTWSSDICSNGTFLTDGRAFEYSIIGIKNYTCLGKEKIIINKIGYDCVNIGMISDYSVNISEKNTSNSTIVIGHVLGNYWVNKDSGILIKSDRLINQITTMNMPNENNMGIFTETEIDDHIITELKNIY